MAARVQDCDCGFKDSTDPTQSIFTSFFAVNFSSATTEQFNEIFIPATYDVNSPDAAYTRNFSASLVQSSDDGLDLTVLPAVSAEVPCAQIFTRAASYSFGSYHALIQTSPTPGTVTAFYNYKNDSSEVDIEFLSGWERPTLLYTVKPQIYSNNGNPDNSTYSREAWNGTAASFHQDYHDWSFVWLPEIIHFGLDSNYSRFLTTNVPQAPGRIALSQWSDGNPKYSLGPPIQNSTVTVSLLWAVYNDSSADALACRKTSMACSIANGDFKSTTSSGGGDGSIGTVPTTIVVNFAQSSSSIWGPGQLFVLFLLFWHHWCSS